MISISNNPTEKEIEKIKELWKENFKEDSEIYVDYYFSNMFNPKNTYIYKVNNEIACTLQIRDKNIISGIKVLKSGLIVAVITPEKYRRQGYMRKLLNFVIEKMKKEYDEILIQAYNWDVYKSFGFKTSHLIAKGEVATTKTLDAEVDSVELMFESYQDFMSDFTNYEIRTLESFQRIKELEKLGETQIVQSHFGYLLINGNIIYEAIFKDERALLELLACLNGRYEISVPPLYKDKVKWLDSYKEEIFMMSIPTGVLKERKNSFIIEYI